MLVAGSIYVYFTPVVASPEGVIPSILTDALLESFAKVIRYLAV